MTTKNTRAIKSITRSLLVAIAVAQLPVPSFAGNLLPTYSSGTSAIGILNSGRAPSSSVGNAYDGANVYQAQPRSPSYGDVGNLKYQSNVDSDGN